MQNPSKKVNNDNVRNEEEHFYLLITGQKIGPFSPQEIKNKIEQKEILSGQLVSQDEGKTWIKIFELETFSKEMKRGSYLPHLPENNSFFFSNNETYMQLKLEDQKGKANSSSFFIPNLKQKEAMAKETAFAQSLELNQIFQRESQKRHRLFVLFSFVMVAGIIIVGMLNYFYAKDLPRGNFVQKPREENILKGIVKKREFKKISHGLKRAGPILDDKEKEKIAQNRKMNNRMALVNQNQNGKTKGKAGVKKSDGNDDSYDYEQDDYSLEDDAPTNSPSKDVGEANNQNDVITQKDVDEYRKDQNQFQNLTQKTRPSGTIKPIEYENLNENSPSKRESFDE